MLEQGLQSIRRRNGEDLIYFINNTSSAAFDGWTTLETPCESVVVYNPMNKEAGLAQINHKNETTTEIRLQLQPGESCILKVAVSEINVPPYHYYKKGTGIVNINGEWTVEFLEGGPELPATYKTKNLGSWTDVGESQKNFSGTAKYAIEFKMPKAKTGAWLLDLGKVHETAEVFVNGKRITALIGPVYQVVLSKNQLKKKNKLEVVVANLMANRIRYMDRNNIPWKIFYNTNMPARKRENSKNGIFDASQWEPLPSGLLGPVTITALQDEK
jgi:hypothetical protein